MRSPLIIILMFGIFFGKKSKAQSPVNKQSIHSFVVKDISGNDFKFSDLKGKKVMIVNTASKCGLTPQYEDLQKLYSEYKEKDFVIVGFPANNFMFQEPGSNEDIASFCQINYGVDFPMMAKISVKGKNQHELYTFLTKKSLNGVSDSSVSWNFQKYLIDEDGYLVMSVSPKTNPYDAKVISWLNGSD